MERIERENPVIKALHKCKPSTVVVYERGKLDAPRTVKLSAGRNRWRALLDMLDALAWERVEGRDEANNTLCICEPDDDAAVEESTALVPTGGAPDRVDDVRDIVLIMRDVQRETLREARDIFSAQADATSRMLESVTDAMRTMRETYEVAIKLAVANAATGGGESDGMQTMLQMAMMMGGGRPNVTPIRPAAPAVPVKKG